MLSRVKKALLTASIATGIVTQPACKPRAMDPGETLEAGEKLIKEDLISNPVSVNFDRFVNVSRRTKVERLSTDETIEIMNKNNLTALKRKDFPVLDGLLKKLEKDLELPEIIVFTNNFGFPNPSNELEFSSIPKTEKDNDRFINKLVLHIGKNTLENIEAGRLTIDVVYGALSHEIGHIITQIDPEKKEVNYKKATVLDYARAARLYAEDEELSDLASACIAGPSAMIATLKYLEGYSKPDVPKIHINGSAITFGNVLVGAHPPPNHRIKNILANQDAIYRNCKDPKQFVNTR